VLSTQCALHAVVVALATGDAGRHAAMALTLHIDPLSSVPILFAIVFVSITTPGIVHLGCRPQRMWTIRVCKRGGSPSRRDQWKAETDFPAALSTAHRANRRWIPMDGNRQRPVSVDGFNLRPRCSSVHRRIRAPFPYCN